MPPLKRSSVHLALAPALILTCTATALAAGGGPAWPAPPADPVIELESVLSKLTHFEVAIQGPIEGKPRRIQKLKRPSGIAFDARGRLLVSDSRQRVLLQIDPDLGVALVFGTGTRPSLQEPRGVAADGEGTIYVADAGLRAVVAFNAQGEVAEVYGEGWLQEPTDVALSPDGTRLYVADARANNIAIFDVASEDKVDTLGARGKGVGEFYLPMAVEFDPAGNLLVVDQLNARVQVFDSNGAYARALAGTGGGGFTRPHDVAADRSGRLFVTDSAESRIQIYGADLEALAVVGRNGLGEGEFLEIGGIAAGGGRLAVLDQAGGRVQLFRLHGAEPAAAPAPEAPRPVAAAAAAKPEMPVVESATAPTAQDPEPLEATSLADPIEPPVATPEQPPTEAPAPSAAGEPGEVMVEESITPAMAELESSAASADPVDETPVAQRLLELVKAWAAAWSAQDVERYLGFYARSFRPADGSSRQAWSERRRERVSGPSSIEVGVEIVETRLGGDGAEITFLQSYRSDRYSDRVRKALGLVMEEGEWKIERETVLETLD